MYLSRRRFIAVTAAIGMLMGPAFAAGRAFASTDRVSAGASGSTATDGTTASGQTRPEEPPAIPDGATPLDAAIDVVDGSGKVVGRVSCRYILSSKERQIAVGYAFENMCDEAITSLRFEVTYLDAAGINPRGKFIAVNEYYQDVPVEPGQTRYFENPNYFEGAETAVTARIANATATTESELPRWTEPKPGNDIVTFCNDPAVTAHFEACAENPPVRVECIMEGTASCSTEDPELIQRVVQAMQTVRIGQPTPAGVVGAGIWYVFYGADGSSWGFFFEDDDIFTWHGQNYVVESWGDMAGIEIPVDPDMPVYGGS